MSTIKAQLLQGYFLTNSLGSLPQDYAVLDVEVTRLQPDLHLSEGGHEFVVQTLS